MKTQRMIESLIRQVTDLPEEAQAEVVQSLLDLRSQHLGIYQIIDEIIIVRNVRHPARRRPPER
jgi:hypothetical protein